MSSVVFRLAYVPIRSAVRSNSQSSSNNLARVAGPSPSVSRNFSYLGICFSQAVKAFSQSSSLLKRLARSQVSSGLTLLRMRSFLVFGLCMESEGVRFQVFGVREGVPDDLTPDARHLTRRFLP